MTGKVKWFDPEKGFGFINSGEGEEVTFELSRTTRGLQARNVIKVLA